MEKKKKMDLGLEKPKWNSNGTIFNCQSLTFDLLLHRLRCIQPVLDIVRVRELQSKVVLLDEIQGVEDLLVQIGSHGLFLYGRERVRSAGD